MLKFTRLNKNITLTETDKPVIWKCNGLVIETLNQCVLIDCNFDENEMKEIIAFSVKPVSAYYTTHTHIDHITHLHVIERLGIPVFAPSPEDCYIRDVKNLLKFSGADDLHVSRQMIIFAKKIQGFREVKSVQSYQPGETFIHDDIVLKTIPLPGHSPGHSGFLIAHSGSDDKHVLFASDIGLDNFGPWYGFKNCNLKDYRNSIHYLKEIYNLNNVILASSHHKPTFEKKPEVFDKLILRMEKTEKRLLKKLSSTQTVSVKDLTFKGIYYRLITLSEMDEIFMRLYYFWEYFIILNHLIDLQERKVVQCTEGNKWYLLNADNFETAI